MPPVGSRHAGKVSRLAEKLTAAVGERAIVRVQSPIRLGDDSEVEPDIAVVLRRADYYEGAHPGARDVLLLVEISDSTLLYDRDVKARLYARHGMPEL